MEFPLVDEKFIDIVKRFVVNTKQNLVPLAQCKCQATNQKCGFSFLKIPSLNYKHVGV